MDPRIDLTEDRMFRNDGEPVAEAFQNELGKYAENYKLLEYADAMLELFGVPINTRYPGVEYDDSVNDLNRYFQRIRINYDLVSMPSKYNRFLENLRYKLYYDLLLDEKSVIHLLDDRSKDIYVTYRVIKDIAKGYINRHTSAEESYYDEMYEEFEKLVSEPLFGEPEVVKDPDTQEWFRQLVFYDPLKKVRKYFTNTSNAITFSLKRGTDVMSKSPTYHIVYNIDGDYTRSTSTQRTNYYYTSSDGERESLNWINISDGRYDYLNDSRIDIESYFKKLIFYDNHEKIDYFADAEFARLLIYEKKPVKNPAILPAYRAIDFDFDDEELQPLRRRANDNFFLNNHLNITMRDFTTSVEWVDF